MRVLHRFFVGLLSGATVGTLLLWAASYLTWPDIFESGAGTGVGFKYTKRAPEFPLVMGTVVTVHRGQLFVRHSHEVFSPAQVAKWTDRPPRHLSLFGFQFNYWESWFSAKTTLLVPLARLGVVLAAYPVLAFVSGPVRRWARRRRGRCDNCGYDLTANVSGVCPECGTRANVQTSKSQNGETEAEGTEPGP